jgi:hypothetical protein
MTDELNSVDPNVQAIIAAARRPVTIDADARQRLAEALRGEAAPRRPHRLAWLVEPRSFALPPLTTVAMAAGLVGIGVITGIAINRDGRATTEQLPAVAVVRPQLPDSVAPRAVKFVLIAPQASRVSVVGDFNGWDTGAAPAERQADGSWVAFVNLTPGRHVYAFVLDGSHFVPDPSAPIAPDDGYGQRNSVALVPRSTS